MEVSILNLFKRKRKMEEEIKSLRIRTLRYYFHMEIYYSIQHIRWISLFVTLLNGFQGLLRRSYIRFSFHASIKPSYGSARILASNSFSTLVQFLFFFLFFFLDAPVFVNSSYSLY